MDQENINKLAEWIKANSNYPESQLRQTALQNGATESDFNAALNTLNTQTASLEYKGIGIRFLAMIIDNIFFTVLFIIFIIIFSATYEGGCDSGFFIGSTVTVNGYETFYGLCGIPAQLYFLTILAYYVLMEWKLGGTLGKLATKIKVVKVTGEPLDFKTSLIRNILRIVDFIPFSYLVGAISIANSKTKQRVGDRVAKTVVVSKN